MSKTTDNLKAAFAGESQANRKYLAFAKKADEEGFAEVARLFRAAAESETVHALRHLREMGGIGSTAENLQAAIAGETEEFTSMYPRMIKDAEAEGNKGALMGFTSASAVEQEHAGLYKKALELLGKNPAATYWVCQVCGHVHEGGAPPEKCPVCGAPGKMFKLVD